MRGPDVNFPQTIAGLRAWYQTRYGVELTDYKLAQMASSELGRRVNPGAISRVAAGQEPKYSLGRVLLELARRYVENVISQDENGVTSA